MKIRLKPLQFHHFKLAGATVPKNSQIPNLVNSQFIDALIFYDTENYRSEGVTLPKNDSTFPTSELSKALKIAPQIKLNKSIEKRLFG